ncbi:MAG TPA: protein-glutamate O-methyltransferase CheR [Elusimicrobiota bacterium]|nr:protein-glutamate O-methyltransferase CheR [Elusimicrobiota bacterium]
MLLTTEEFTELRDMIYAESGIYFKEEKTYFIVTRLTARMGALNCADVSEYIQYLKFDKSKAELYRLIDALTTNETFFYRDLNQIEGFATEVLPQIVKRKREMGQRTIRLWSAGCSTGEEPYTLAIILHEYLKDLICWNIQLFATDISQRVLNACRIGTYPPRSMKDVPEDIRERYFEKVDHTYKINFDIRKMVQFSMLNLSSRGLVRTMSNMDCIFCRNVLIYFNDESANQVVNSFYDNLTPGGFLFLGHAESIHRYSAAFRMVKLRSSFVYKKE